MNKRVKKILESFAAKTLVLSLGVKGYVVRKLWQYVIVYVWRDLEKRFRKHINEEKAKKETIKGEKYEETLKDGVTEKAQRDATIDFLNGAD